MTATIHARFRCAFPGFDLDVDLTLPGTGITALFGPLRLRQDHAASVHGRPSERARNHDRSGRTLADGRVPSGRYTSAPWRTCSRKPSFFPHLNVRRNLEFGYRRIPRRRTTDQIR